MVESSFLIVLASGLGGQALRIADKSDWWSFLNENVPEPTVEGGTKALAEANFTILGLSTGSQFEEIAARLGKAQSVQRRDASSVREQVCYASATPPPVVHLVFEFGEAESVFYLFSGGKDWNGSDLCHKSEQISAGVKNAI